MAQSRWSGGGVVPSLVVAAVLLCSALPIAQAGFPVAKSSEYTSDDFITYGTELGLATGGMGLGISAVFGLIMFISMIVCCCRCCRLRNDDLAAANLSDKGDPELAQSNETVSKHKKILWISSLFIFLGYIACAATAYSSVSATDDTFLSIYEGTDAFMVELNDALCTNEDEQTGTTSTNNCEDGSVGYYFYELVDTFVVYVDEVLEFTETVDDPLEWVGTNVTRAAESLARSVVILQNINNSIVTINQASEDAAVTGFDLDLTYVSSDQAGQLDTASDNLDGVGDNVDEVLSALTDAIDTEVITEQADNVTTLMYDLVQDLYGVTEDITTARNGGLVDAHDAIESNLALASVITGAVIFLPAVFLFLFAALSVLCRSAKPFYGNMGFVFFAQGTYAFIGGFFLVLYTLLSDTCDVHRDLITVNLEGETLSVESVTSNDLAMATLAILDCDGEPGDTPDSTNNLVDIMGIGDIFNITEYLSPISEVLVEVADAVSDNMGDLTSAQDSLDELDLFIELDISNGFNLTESTAEVDDAEDTATTGAMDDLDTIRQELVYIDGNLTLFAAEQEEMGIVQTNMNTSIGVVGSRTGGLVDSLRVNLWTINDAAMDANEYTMCGYIGDFYRSVYTGAICTDVTTDLRAVAIPAIFVLVLMFISFMVHGCFGPSMRKRPEELSSDAATQGYGNKDNKGGYQRPVNPNDF